jgi:hypothetical protein
MTADAGTVSIQAGALSEDKSRGPHSSMPQSISIGLLVLGGVLLLVAIIGGNFKIFGAEVDAKISNVPLRLLAGMLGLSFVLLALAPSLRNSGDSSQPVANPPSNKAQAIPAETKSSEIQPAEQTNPAPPVSKPVSRFGAAIVFDPPSNIRTSPSGSAPILCSVQAKTTINIQENEGNWYSTDVCGGRIGYIHRSQIRFSE